MVPTTPDMASTEIEHRIQIIAGSFRARPPRLPEGRRHLATQTELDMDAASAGIEKQLTEALATAKQNLAIALERERGPLAAQGSSVFIPGPDK